MSTSRPSSSVGPIRCFLNHKALIAHSIGHKLFAKHHRVGVETLPHSLCAHFRGGKRYQSFHKSIGAVTLQ